MNKSELEKKPLSDLHSLAAEAGVERFRMLTKAELVEKLADPDGGGSGGSPAAVAPRAPAAAAPVRVGRGVRSADSAPAAPGPTPVPRVASLRRRVAPSAPAKDVRRFRRGPLRRLGR